MLLPACLLSSCGSSWAQSHSQAGCWSHSSGLLPITVDCVSVYISATPIGLGVPGTLPDSSCPHCGPVWGHIRSRSPNVCVQGTVFSVFAPKPEDSDEASKGWGGCKARLMRVHQMPGMKAMAPEQWSCSLPWPSRPRACLEHQRKVRPPPPPHCSVRTKASTPGSCPHLAQGRRLPAVS